MIITGIELSASNAIFSAINVISSAEHHVIPIAKPKLSLSDDESKEDIQSMQRAIEALLRENRMEKGIIIKRNKSGGFAGGAVSFKIETLFLIQNITPIRFISPQTIAAAQKKEPRPLPGSLNKYQHQAYLAAVIGANL